jgi:hypothetical protein
MKRDFPHIHRFVAAAALPALMFAVVGLVADRAIAADNTRQSAADWVRAVYVRQIAWQNEARAMASNDYLALFAPPLRNLLLIKAPPMASAGPSLNSFFGWGVLPRQPFTLAGVRTVTASPRTVAVDLTFRGAPYSVRVQVVPAGKAWQIANIFYPHGDDLLAAKRKTASLR